MRLHPDNGNLPVKLFSIYLLTFPPGPTILVKVKQEGRKMYTTQNFKTKKELKAAVVAGKRVTVFQPGPFGGTEPKTGKITIEGPHYPEPHKFYAEAWLENGVVVKVK